MRISKEIAKKMDKDDLMLLENADQSSSAFYCEECKETFVNYETEYLICEICGKSLDNINIDFNEDLLSFI